MVIIGGMRSLLGPALGALFYILFREFLSIWTPNWLLFFGLLFVGFVVYSPTGLVGVWRRFTEPMRPKVVEAAAMAGRTIEQAIAAAGVPASRDAARRALRSKRAISRRRSAASRRSPMPSFVVQARTLHALIGPNGAGKTTVFNLISGLFAPDRGSVTLGGAPITGLAPHRTVAAGLARSFQITNLFAGAVDRGEPAPCRAGARSSRTSTAGRTCASIERVTRRTAELIRFLGLSGIERADAGTLSYGGQRLLDMGLALASASARAAARRAARGTRRGRARARRQLDQAHLGGHSRCCSSSTTSIACSRSPIA